MDSRKWPRRLPVGAGVSAEPGVHFRVWAPRRRKVAVVLEGGTVRPLDKSAPTVGLAPEDNGYFSGPVAHAHAGTLYRYRLDDGDTLYPDPVARFQPHGPHGPSQDLDPRAYPSTDRRWRSTSPLGQVFYAMHPGTVPKEGTW